MTHTTETRRTIAPRRRSLEQSDAMQPMGISSAPTGSVASRAFALRFDCAALGGNGIEGRAISKGEDS
jgi:hypothetical protein